MKVPLVLICSVYIVYVVLTVALEHFIIISESESWVEHLTVVPALVFTTEFLFPLLAIYQMFQPLSVKITPHFVILFEEWKAYSKCR